MANVRLFQPFDLSQPSLGGNILNAVVTRQTSNQVVIDFDDEQILFQGQNITYSSKQGNSYRYGLLSIVADESRIGGAVWQ